MQPFFTIFVSFGIVEHNSMLIQKEQSPLISRSMKQLEQILPFKSIASIVSSSQYCSDGYKFRLQSWMRWKIFLFFCLSCSNRILQMFRKYFWSNMTHVQFFNIWFTFSLGMLTLFVMSLILVLRPLSTISCFFFNIVGCFNCVGRSECSSSAM